MLLFNPFIVGLVAEVCSIVCWVKMEKMRQTIFSGNFVLTDTTVKLYCILHFSECSMLHISTQIK